MAFKGRMQKLFPSQAVMSTVTLQLIHSYRSVLGRKKTLLNLIPNFVVLIPRYRCVVGGYYEVTRSLNMHPVNLASFEKQLDRIIRASV